jgi:hypothetical protein
VVGQYWRFDSAFRCEEWHGWSVACTVPDSVDVQRGPRSRGARGVCLVVASADAAVPSTRCACMRQFLNWREVVGRCAGPSPASQPTLPDRCFRGQGSGCTFVLRAYRRAQTPPGAAACCPASQLDHGPDSQSPRCEPSTRRPQPFWLLGAPPRVGISPPWLRGSVCQHAECLGTESACPPLDALPGPTCLPLCPVRARVPLCPVRARLPACPVTRCLLPCPHSPHV